MVLGVESQVSPFAPNIDSHARGLTREQKITLGVIHLGIMSFYYPVVEDDDADDFRSRIGTPSEIASDIRNVCEALRRNQRDMVDRGQAVPSNLIAAFEHFLALPPAPAKNAHFLPRTTRVGLVNYALQELLRNGFLAQDGGEGVNARYASLPKYRIYVRRLSSHEMARLIRLARAGEEFARIAEEEEPNPDLAENADPAGEAVAELSANGATSEGAEDVDNA
jgi:hypothetical protein